MTRLATGNKRRVRLRDTRSLRFASFRRAPLLRLLRGFLHRLPRGGSLHRLLRGFLHHLLRGRSHRHLALRLRRRFASRRFNLIGCTLRMPSQELGQRQSCQTDGLWIGFGDHQVVSPITAHYHSAASRRTIWDYCRNQKRVLCQFAFHAVLKLLRILIIAGRITRLVSAPETKLDQLSLDLLSLLFSHLLDSSLSQHYLRGFLRVLLQKIFWPHSILVMNRCLPQHLV